MPDSPKRSESRSKSTPQVRARRPRLGWYFTFTGIAITLSPLVLAVLTTQPGANMWSESDPNSGGTYLWGLLLTLPVGTVITVTGLIIATVQTIRYRRTLRAL